jgi:hypothetical protein
MHSIVSCVAAARILNFVSTLISVSIEITKFCKMSTQIQVKKVVFQLIVLKKNRKTVISVATEKTEISRN